MPQVSELLAIAAAEVGYREKASAALLDSKADNPGSKNYTRYARDLAAAGYYQASKQGFEWCDVFVDWCFYKLCGSRQEAETLTCQTGPYGAGCDWSARYYKNAGRYFDTGPQAGDQIFFGYSGFEHTGLVESVGKSTLTTIEGNSANAVRRRTYALTDPWIRGYGRPRYDTSSTPAPPAAAAEQRIQLQLRQLRQGDRGEGVKAAQKLLGLTADGIFGPRTAAAARAFQKEKGLSPDGIIGEKTWGKLLGL